MNAYTKALGIAATPAGKGALRLHLNENSGGCSPAVLQALRSLTPDQVSSYPDYGPALDAVAAWYGVPADWIMLVNGLDEGVPLAVSAVNRLPLTVNRLPSTVNRSPLTVDRLPPTVNRCVVLEPAFDMYAVAIRNAGCELVRVAPRPNFEFSVDDVLEASKDASLIFLTDPNNPTGVGIPADAIEAIATARPDATIFLDEAYGDFAGRTFVSKLVAAPERFSNVIVARTFSKSFGLAGLRIGALIAPPSTLAPIEAMPSPFNVNVAAATALVAALGDRAWVASTVAEANESKQAVYEFCDRWSLEYWRSEANFVLIRVGADAAASAAMVDALAGKGVLVRDRSVAAGCAGCIRLTTGLLAHTATALRAMEEILASRTN